jgi:hypothetical protein
VHPAGLVQESINKCDVDLRREMYNSIILSGARPARFARCHACQLNRMQAGSASRRSTSFWKGHL